MNKLYTLFLAASLLLSTNTAFSIIAPERIDSSWQSLRKAYDEVQDEGDENTDDLVKKISTILKKYKAKRNAAAEEEKKRRQYIIYY